MWMFRPPRGPKASKFVHQWLGPLRIVESAGYENSLIERKDDGENHEQFIAHVSFLVTYRRPAILLGRDLEEQLEYESTYRREEDVETATASARPAAATINTAYARRGAKQTSTTVADASSADRTGKPLVEVRRRRRRNKAGQYVLEYLLRPRREDVQQQQDSGTCDGDRRWVSITEYEKLFNSGKVVEDLGVDGGV